MRCVCCNRQLNDFEATRRLKSTGEFADTCNKCVKEMGGMEFIVRTDLQPDEAIDDADNEV